MSVITGENFHPGSPALLHAGAWNELLNTRIFEMWGVSLHHT